MNEIVFTTGMRGKTAYLKISTPHKECTEIYLQVLKQLANGLASKMEQEISKINKDREVLEDV
jgi:hypothetical protein